MGDCLTFTDAAKSFPTVDGERKIFSGLSFSFCPGRVYVVKGKSGSGKSTLLSIVGLLGDLTSGSYSFFGRDVGSLSESDKDSLRSKNVSFLFQDDNVLPFFSGRENLELVSDDSVAISAWAQKLGIETLLDKKASSYSKGEETRLALSRVFLEDKKVMLLDEPTGNLDEKNARNVYGLLSELAKDKIIIVVSHDFDLFEEFSAFVELKFDEGEIKCLRGEFFETNSLLAKGQGAPTDISFKKQVNLAKKIIAFRPWKSISYFVFGVVLSLLSSLTLSFLSVSPASLAVNKATDYGLAFAKVTNSDGKGLFRRYGVIGKSGETSLPLTLAYQSADATSFYGDGNKPQDGEILIPSYVAEKFSLSENSDVVIPVGKSSLTLKADLIGVDAAPLIASLQGRGLSSEQAVVEALSFFPSLVSKKTISDYELLDSVWIGSDSFKPLFSLFSKEGLSFSAGRYIDSRSAFSLEGTSSLKSGEVALAISDSQLTEEALAAFDKNIKGKSFSFLKEEKDGKPDFSALFEKYKVVALESISDGIADGSLSIEFSSNDKAIVSEHLSELGLYSDYGHEGWMLPLTSKEASNILKYKTDLFGFVSQGDLESLSFVSGGAIYVGLLFGFLVLLQFSFGVFYIFSCVNSFRQGRVVLRAIGERKSESGIVLSLASGAVTLSSFVLGIGILYPSLLQLFSHWLSSALSLSTAFSLANPTWMVLIFPFVFLLLIPLLVLLAAKGKKISLAEEMQISRE